MKRLKVIGRWCWLFAFWTMYLNLNPFSNIYFISKNIKTQRCFEKGSMFLRDCSFYLLNCRKWMDSIIFSCKKTAWLECGILSELVGCIVWAFWGERFHVIMSRFVWNTVTRGLLCDWLSQESWDHIFSIYSGKCFFRQLTGVVPWRVPSRAELLLTPLLALPVSATVNCTGKQSS